MAYGSLDLHTATSQEVFSFVIDHLRTQGHSARDDEGSCKYRTENHEACAVGCLIPDADYNTEFEGKSPTTLFSLDSPETNPFVRLGFHHHTALLTSLQKFHDSRYSWDSPEDFDRIAATIAESFGLTLPERNPS